MVGGNSCLLSEVANVAADQCTKKNILMKFWMMIQRITYNAKVLHHIDEKWCNSDIVVYAFPTMRYWWYSKERCSISALAVLLLYRNI